MSLHLQLTICYFHDFNQVLNVSLLNISLLILTVELNKIKLQIFGKVIIFFIVVF